MDSLDIPLLKGWFWPQAATIGLASRASYLNLANTTMMTQVQNYWYLPTTVAREKCVCFLSISSVTENIFIHGFQFWLNN